MRLPMITTLFLLLSSSNFLMADGKLFWQFEASIPAPKQRAAIFFNNGIETLVIESNFSKPPLSTPSSQLSKEAPATHSYAWIVPLPDSPNQISMVERNYLALVAHRFRPSVISSYNGHWSFLLLFCLFILFARILYSHTSSWIIGILFPLFIYTILLASLTASGGSIKGIFGTINGSLGSIENVTVLDRREIGSFETAVISSEDPYALINWLKNESYHISPNLFPVIKDYGKDRWVFFVARLRQPREVNEIIMPHPLSFTFRTDVPIYPMRLTGVDNDDCDVCIFLISDKEAFCKKLVTKSATIFERTYRDYYPPYTLDGKNPRPGYSEFLNHCNQIASSGRVIVTKLVGTISPEDSKDDITFNLKSAVPFIETYYTKNAAFSKAMDSAVWFPSISFLLWALFSFKPTKANCTLLGLSVIIGLLFFLLEYRSLPISEIHLRQVSSFETDIE